MTEIQITVFDLKHSLASSQIPAHAHGSIIAAFERRQDVPGFGEALVREVNLATAEDYVCASDLIGAALRKSSQQAMDAGETVRLFNQEAFDRKSASSASITAQVNKALGERHGPALGRTEMLQAHQPGSPQERTATAMQGMIGKALGTTPEPTGKARMAAAINAQLAPKTAPAAAADPDRAKYAGLLDKLGRSETFKAGMLKSYDAADANVRAAFIRMAEKELAPAVTMPAPAPAATAPAPVDPTPDQVQEAAMQLAKQEKAENIMRADLYQIERMSKECGKSEAGQKVLVHIAKAKGAKALVASIDAKGWDADLRADMEQFNAEGGWKGVSRAIAAAACAQKEMALAARSVAVRNLENATP